jgi:hypothetical protein
MEPKSPVLLVVLVETGRMRWFVASIGLDGRTTPLICSEPNDLARYRELEFDEQVAFLRHRFCGTLQRGNDRLWARNNKASRFIFVFEGPFVEPSGRLTEAIASHFTEWLLNPPATILVSSNGFPESEPPHLTILAGGFDAGQEQLLHNHLGALLAARDDPAVWEVARKDGVWCARMGE